MMIKNYLITGDTHGKVAYRLNFITSYKPEETAVIILGDAGINFYLNKTDKREKEKIQKSGFTVYCVRGNHEERPENIPGMKIIYDARVHGEVYFEEEYPNILYFKDGGNYIINGLRVLVIGGAYSVDKFYRLAHFPKDAKWTGWFKDEQLTKEEMQSISNRYRGERFDLVLSHTCPYSWRPTDLFLSGLDQSTVDNSMEQWLEGFRKKISYNIWLFGHYHDDRFVRPGVEMFSTDIENLDDIVNRWKENNEWKFWYFKKDPKYYMKDSDIDA